MRLNGAAIAVPRHTHGNDERRERQTAITIMITSTITR